MYKIHTEKQNLNGICSTHIRISLTNEITFLDLEDIAKTQIQYRDFEYSVKNYFHNTIYFITKNDVNFEY